MNKTICVVIVLVIQLLISFAAYQYLTHRNDEKIGFRNILRLKFEYVHLLVVLIAFFISSVIFVVGFLWNNELFMRAFMNASVMLWLCIVGYIDARERIIPNGLIGIGILFWLVLLLIDIFLGGTPWLKLLVFSAIGGIGCGGLLFVIAIIVRSALGMGDVKMFFVLGLLYGLADAYGVLLFSIIAMGLVSIILLIAKKVTTKSTIPMAPFVVLGFILSILSGM